MTLRTVWNSLRVLAIVTLGSALVVLNIVLAVPPRHLFADLTFGHVDRNGQDTLERIEHVQHESARLLLVNMYGIPLLMCLALSPYARAGARRHTNEQGVKPERSVT